jgi:hypothetical protein
MTPPFATETTTSSAPSLIANDEADSSSKHFAKLKELIFTRRPILADIMSKHGDRSLHDYAQDFIDVNSQPLLDQRKPELVGVVKNLLSMRLGDEVAEGVAAQLSRLPLVSTADHHGPITHPFFVNSNIISAIPALAEQKATIPYLIAFSFATVSVNNTSFPRGITFHGGADGSGEFLRLSILPDSTKMGVAYGMRRMTADDLEKAEQQLAKRGKSGELVPDKEDLVRGILKKYFGNEDVLSAPDFSSQVTKINYKLWPDIFHARDEQGRSTIPDLIYLDIESIVSSLLLKLHLQNTSSLIYRLLFTADLEPLALKHFNNIPGAFSNEDQWGTYFFWAVDKKWRRVRLVKKGDFLVSPDGTHSIPFTAEGIAQALEKKEIFPSMLLCYLMVSLYYGMKCLGGFSQVHDLTLVKEAWGKILTEIGELEEAAALKPVQTKELGGDGMVLAYLATGGKDIAPATGIDMLFDPTTSFARYMELSKKITLSEAMTTLLPDIYTVLYSLDQRDPEIAGLTSEMLLKASTLYKKILA